MGNEIHTKCYGPGAHVLVQESQKSCLEITLKLRSNYILTHSHETPSLKKDNSLVI